MNKLPKEVNNIIEALKAAGYEAYAVGGCARDLIMGREPKDWDITTNAKPENIQQVFPNSVYENKFGTVGVKTGSDKPNLAIVEVTTYRVEQGYSDKRHPDKVKFVSRLEDDLARRDFTINAIAMDGKTIIDPFDGQKDIADKIINTVGEPVDRFSEDYLRMLRAIRFACELGFSFMENKESFMENNKLMEIITEISGKITEISAERIRDEFFRIILSDDPRRGIELMRQTRLLDAIIPELTKGVGVSQNKHHIYTIYDHAVLSLKAAADNKFGLEIRLAAMFHDIAKPQTKQGEGIDATFHNHDIVGAGVAKKILGRLRVSREIIEKVYNLVRFHMFYYNVGEVTEAGVRRLLRKVGGVDNFKDLLSLRIADRLGSGVPKAVPYKLRHLQYLVDKVSADPISVGMLKINGNDIIKILGIEPGPKIGLVLNALLVEVLENPKLNTKKYLSGRVGELANKPDKELRQMAEVIEEKKEEVDLEIKKKHYVK